MNSYKRVNSILTISVDSLASPGVNKHKICIPECWCSPMSLCVSRDLCGLCNVITQYCYTSQAHKTSLPKPLKMIMFRHLARNKLYAAELLKVRGLRGHKHHFGQGVGKLLFFKV